MIIALVALQLVTTHPAPPKTQATAVQQHVPARLDATTQRRLSDARALLANAKQIRATYVPRPGQPSNEELDASIAELKDRLDSLPEMGEMEQLRLQMAMDRLSKTQSTLSNLLKKISDTQSAVVQNIK